MARQIEVSTHMKNLRLRDKREPVVVLQIKIIPRGSGNRLFARRLAKQFRTDAEMGPHVIKVVAGSSSVTVHMRPSLDLLFVINRIAERQRQRKLDAKQLPLFSGGALA